MNDRIAHMTALLIVLAAGLALPYLTSVPLPRLAMLWLFMTLAIGWHITAAQAGYLPLGSVVFFGIGIYAAAVLQISLYHPLAEYVSASARDTAITFTPHQIFTGLALGIPFGGLTAMLAAMLLGPLLLSLPRQHFAIATLGLALALPELAAGWQLIGGGAGLPLPPLPQDMPGADMFYRISLVMAALALLLLAWLRATHMRLALNALREDEEKARALGLATLRHKVLAFSLTALLCGLAGAVYGNLVRLVDPFTTAFDLSGPGTWVAFMVVLGGMTTFWGPAVGALAFFGLQELLLPWAGGWHQALLAALVLIAMAMFPRGMSGWLTARWPRLFAASRAMHQPRHGASPLPRACTEARHV